ncbi:hypothetical protein ACHAXA_006373 [Cyclostephanos tholiformis]|uniref:Transmembrane protein n=1 Tax=Cyclostephanos tholiformis TaxID=382380 RepID=A0ABD3R1F0_9STRA
MSLADENPLYDKKRTSMSSNRFPPLVSLLLLGGDSILGSSSIRVVHASATDSMETPAMASQLWNPMSFHADTEIDGAIMKGLHGVGIFLLGWFCIMSVVGIGMRCYLCCDKLRSGERDMRRLYDSFADTNGHDNEGGGTALEMS